ncbi:MAG TPA: hypothetical protein VKM72_29655 [Thermoanaerobaculia bacterium]|nr:hypothetical protein [Thermoanaerobaculia bacterium]
MKKRTENKLKLSTETLRTLAGLELQRAEGGGTTGDWGGTSSASACTGTLFSDCHCGATSAC